MIDLRSDTVTRPTPAMLEAMVKAPVGDDVLGDDPTVQELEAVAAARMGKDAAVFVPSGTMGNQIGLAAQVERGDSILVEEDAHLIIYEVAGAAILAGVIARTLPSHRGVMDPALVESRILKASLHTPGTSLIALENSHNRAGGTVIPMATLRAYRDIADRHGLKIHMDGARVFNAATALGVYVKEIADPCDTITFCLSKGLRSPVGSVLCGPRETIERARVWRKRLGGGMRQSGILAACGLVSLHSEVGRLSEDHRRARRMAEVLAQVPGLSVDLEGVQTNIVMADTAAPADRWVSALAGAGVAFFAFGPHRLRLVFHADVDDAMTDAAIEAFRAARV